MKYETAILATHLCDNNSDCPVIKNCPQKAVSYSHDTKRVYIDEVKCTACSLCEKNYCTLFAMSHSEVEYASIRRKNSEDTRTQADLQVDRFGADIVDNDLAIDEIKWESEIMKFISQNTGLYFVEIVVQADSSCLYDSIPIADHIDISHYRKVLLYDMGIAEKIRKQYDFYGFPVILVFYQYQMVDMITGIYKNSNDSEKNSLANRIQFLYHNYNGGVHREPSAITK